MPKTVARRRPRRQGTSTAWLKPVRPVVGPTAWWGTATPVRFEQARQPGGGQPIQLQFTPHLMPMVRGLLATVYGPPAAIPA